MLALLPVLIFDSALNIKYYEFRKHFWEILALAGPCFLVGFALLGVSSYYVLHYVFGFDGWSIEMCLLYRYKTYLIVNVFLILSRKDINFSSTISATDPVAVVMLLSKLTVPHRLRLLLEGESLLNDGIALILYK